MIDKNRPPVKTARTSDQDAIAINKKLNDVSRMIEIGQAIKAIIRDRFSGDLRGFRRWVRMNLDKDEKSILRYLTLAEHADFLGVQGIIRLKDAYALLGIDMNVSVAKAWGLPEDNALVLPSC